MKAINELNRIIENAQSSDQRIAIDLKNWKAQYIQRIYQQVSAPPAIAVKFGQQALVDILKTEAFKGLGNSVKKYAKIIDEDVRLGSNKSKRITAEILIIGEKPNDSSISKGN